jgi:hypothetical protein
MGKIITSPEAIEHPFQKSIFLAGGISNCPNWQKDVAERIATETDAIVYNPRRLDFDMTAYEDISRQQIIWEWHALRVSTFNLFWFPQETLCPITLLEYGSAMERLREGALMCGTHPNYQRRFDLIEQTKLKGHVRVFDDLNELVDQTIIMLKGIRDLPPKND